MSIATEYTLIYFFRIEENGVKENMLAYVDKKVLVGYQDGR